MRTFTMIATAATLGLTLTLVGCGAGNAPQDQQAEEQTETTETISGGWTTDTEATSLLTDDERAVFDAATQGQAEGSYAPVATLATQVVAGTNYAFLCAEEPVDGQGGSWHVLVAYQDLQGSVELTSEQEIDLTDVKTVDEDATAGMVGAWAVVTPASADLLPKEAADAFAKASEGYAGVGLAPLATLGSQIVAGTNYLVLCAGTTATAEPQTALYVAKVYADLEGNAEFADVQLFDLLAYLGG